MDLVPPPEHSPTRAELEVTTLGPRAYGSPLAGLLAGRRTTEHYVAEDDRVLLDDTVSALAAHEGLADLPSFEPGGPRRRLFFDPRTVRAGIVTCGGLCPGLNDVIRALTLELTTHYGVRRVLGFRDGFRGLVPRYGLSPVALTLESVSGIGESGGSVLGSSRGEQDPEEVVDTLQRWGIDVLFVVGGDGSMRGALRIAECARSRGAAIAVVGVPKTIDNDIPFIEQSFGFQSAYAAAAEAIRAAHVEARSAPAGVGLVKLMGRHSGFIACYAALAHRGADVVLIPEVPFALDGEGGLLDHLHRRVRDQGHAVVVVAEGAGQEYLPASRQRDASGNAKLGDVGVLLRDRIQESFARKGEELNLRYIDPSYAIRSVPANAYDSVYCMRLAHTAVHAAMAGRTAIVVGRWRGRFVHVPIPLAVSARNTVAPDGDLWLAVLEATGQPPRLGPPLLEPLPAQWNTPAVRTA
ncbi:6-phosphofructokinase [Motilibacter rhizosphaerae]|uniref:ATP-dependent 6-phosphofructokinase n=1 Tax=Motilibacter rhizosphaerae TaxID=598652 RepID=A0A4Q7NQ43_9ACTN|nr:ATP-dependent 6-phosphofructokinase [Motilibacter rhizosphaerae]RZS87323.1 6-phosphofructokinase [Motilibacter rhizosphaerae]